MKILLLISIFYVQVANASEAVIKHGLSPMYGSVMEILHDGHGKHRVSGSIRDLESSGVGEDEELILACYVGSVKDVCHLLEVSLLELNEKENRSGSDEFKLKDCRLNKYENILIDARTKSKEQLGFSLGGMPSCKNVNVK